MSKLLGDGDDESINSDSSDSGQENVLDLILFLKYMEGLGNVVRLFGQAAGGGRIIKKLSPVDILMKQKELIDKVEVATEQISQMPQPLEENGEEYRQFMTYLLELHNAWVGFGNYDVPAHVVEAHYRAIVQVLYKAGTHQVLCHAVTPRLQKENCLSEAENNTTTLSITQILIILRVLVNCSFGEGIKEDFTKDTDFLSALVHTLETGHKAHMNKELSDNQTTILDTCLKILANCTNDDKRVARLRDTRIVEVVLSYLDSHNGLVQLLSLVTLARLVNEKEAENLLTNHVNIFTLLIQRLDRACQSSSHREDWGWSVPGLISTIIQLARNDANKKVLVEKGCLPRLVKILNSQYNAEVEESLEALWVLSFDEDNKQKMVDEPNLVKRVWGIYSDDSSSDKIKKSSYGILWSLTEQLKMGDIEFAGIALKIEYQKSKADMIMKPTEENQAEEQTETPDEFSFKGHVMLSYQSGHKETILTICQELKDAGIPVWIDVDFMEGSTLETMAKAVENCSIFIMAVSKGYKESPNTRLEANYAQKLDKTIIPLMMEKGYKPDGWLGIIMGSNYFYDFSGKYPFENKMSELVKEVKKSMGSPTGSQIPPPPHAPTKAIQRPMQRTLSDQQTPRQTLTDTGTQNDRREQADKKIQTDKPTHTDIYVQTDRETQTEQQMIYRTTEDSGRQGNVKTRRNEYGVTLWNL